MSALDLRALPGALFGSASAHRTTSTARDAAIRGALSTTRRIGFVSLTSGAGTTSLATHVARAVAARRAEPVLAVDVASKNGRGLAHLLGAAPTPPSETRASARTTADARAGLVERDGIVALCPKDQGDAVAAWLGEAAPIARFFEVAITDFGARHPLADLAACAALCDVVCLVGDGRRGHAEEVRALAPAVAGLPEGPTPVLALVDHARAGDGVARAIANADRHPVVFVPFDAGLRDGDAPRSLAARRGVLDLAAVLVAGTPELGT